MSTIRVPVSPGELIDKITILRIKRARIDHAAKLRNVTRELAELETVLARDVPGHPDIAGLTDKLLSVNETLWDIEDLIRGCERAADFGPRFVELARSVYRTNDRRSELKREINLALGSWLVEEKSYAKY